MNLDQPINDRPAQDHITLKELIFKVKEWFRYLLSKWLIILVFGLIGGLLGFIYAYFKKPVYTASTTFVLEDGGASGGGLGNLGGLASMVGVDVGGGGGIFQGDNILELYKSRKMIERTLLSEVTFVDKKQLIVDKYIDINNLREVWKKTPELNGIQFRTKNSLTNVKSIRLLDSVLGSIVNEINKNYLKVGKPDKKLSIIKVEVKSPEESFAKAFNEQIVKNVNDFYIQTKTKKSLENISILQQKTDSVRRTMNGDIYAAAAVTDATPNLNPTRQVQRVAPVQRSQFSAETNKAMLSELLKNLEMSKISLRKETPLIQVIDQPTFPLERQKLGKSRGIIFGGLLFGFLCVLGLLVKKIFSEVIG